MNTAGKIALFIGGALFGSVGVKLLASKDAKKAYTHVTAAALRCKDEVMRNVDAVQENCSDILADAKAINEARAAKKQKRLSRTRRKKSLMTLRKPLSKTRQSHEILHPA